MKNKNYPVHKPTSKQSMCLSSKNSEDQT